MEASGIAVGGPGVGGAGAVGELREGIKPGAVEWEPRAGDRGGADSEGAFRGREGGGCEGQAMAGTATNGPRHGFGAGGGSRSRRVRSATRRHRDGGDGPTLHSRS